MRMRDKTILVLALCLSLPGLAGAVTILGVSAGDSFLFDNGAGLTANISFMGPVTGDPSGGSGQVGIASLPGASDQTFEFQIEMLTGTLVSLSMGAVHCAPGPLMGSAAADCATSFPADFARPSTGAGTKGGSDKDLTNITGTSSSWIFEFDGGSLSAGEVSDVFFASWAPGMIGTDGTYFMIFGSSPAGGSTNVQTVPEPATWMLLGLTFGVVTLSRRRRRNR